MWALPATPVAHAEQATVRLRLAWGSGDGAKHRWLGKIHAPAAQLSDLQPLGIEPDAPAAVRLTDNRITLDPLEKRNFDGCDITYRGDLDGSLSCEVRSDQSAAPEVFQIPVRELLDGQFRQPIDSLGSFLLAYQSPGDRLRVELDREHLIFRPGEVWPLKVTANFAVPDTAEPVLVEATLIANASDAVVWQATQDLVDEERASELLEFEVTCPASPGAYRLLLVARGEEGFATRFVPGQRPKSFASREIDLVVFDPESRVPALTDHWVPVLSFDPANPSWWHRLPSWARVTRLSGTSNGSFGNQRLLPWQQDGHQLVQLSPGTSASQPAWQSYTLPVLDVGAPHLVEITYPANVEQHLAVAILEPDAAGRLMMPVLDSGFYRDEVFDTSATEFTQHRVLFWPRTRSPQLLIVNRHEKLPGVYGTITLSRHDEATSSLIAAAEEPPSDRFLAGYLGKPRLAGNFSAPERLDSASAMSVQDWGTFLKASERFVQHLQLSGYNSAVVCVAADGSALYPSQVLMPSPRFDNGPLAASGQDPIRKDILELLLRVCDAAAVRFVPAIQLATPLPALEEARTAEDVRTTGITLVNAEGQEIRQLALPTATASLGYNLLNPTVQSEILSLIDELLFRYAEHQSLTDVALQLSDSGYGLLPGLDWGFDDQTTDAFSQATGIELPGQGSDRFARRAQLLLGPHRAAWQSWRIEQLTQFFSRVAEHVQQHRPQGQLLLLTDDLFNTAAAQQAVSSSAFHQGTATEVLHQRGLDLSQISALEGVEVTNVFRMAPQQRLQQQATRVLLNEAARQHVLQSNPDLPPQMVLYESTQTALPSFDEQQPFGADRSHLILSHEPVPAGDDRSQLLQTALAAGRLSTLIEGGDYFPMTVNIAHRQLLRTLGELPDEYSESRSLDKQPVLLRVQRTGEATYLVAINQSPWAVTAQVDCESNAPTPWRQLGVDAGSEQTDPEHNQGVLAADTSTWNMELAPYKLQAWKFDSPHIQVTHLMVLDNEAVQDFLQDRISAIESRAGNLNIVRSYPQLLNPGFELQEGVGRIFGWQVRKGPSGTVQVRTTQPHSGLRVLRMQSTDRIGVAVQSHLFPTPETGLLIVGVHLRVERAGDNAQLLIAVQSEDDGRTYRQYRLLSGEQLISQRWMRQELALRDLPVQQVNQLRVLFHAVGDLELRIDDVDLCDLRFDDHQRSELAKRVYSAKTALEDQQVVDCLRLVDGYWSRFLVEYVPPVERPPVVLAEQPPPPEQEETAPRKKVGERLRGLVPRIWR